MTRLAPVFAAALAGGILHASLTADAFDFTCVAAIVTAAAAVLAAIVEARKGSEYAATVNDHEARIRVLESKQT